MENKLKEGYRETEVGIIPMNWDVKSTKKTLYIKGRIGWRGLKKEEFTSEGPYLITGVHFKKNKIDWNSCFHITEERYMESPEIMVEIGDVLFTKDGTIGKVAYIDYLPDKASLNSHLLLLRVLHTNLDSKYLFYVLQSEHFKKYIDINKSGSTLVGLSQSSFEKYKFPVPKLVEQKKIVSILSSVDEAIEKTEAIIEQTEEVKKGLMQQLLTKGIGHMKFKKTEFGEIPEEWESLSFNNVLGFVGSGITPKGGSDVYQLEGIPFIRSQNVYPDGLRLDDIAFISDSIHEKMNRSKVKEHDVLLNITGASIGRCTYVPTGFGEANVNQHVCILRSNEKVYYKYLTYFMNSSLGQRQIFSEQAGQTREGLNYQQIRTFKISVPPMEEQEKIANIIESFNKKVGNERSRLNALQYLKKGLMQSLLTGKVRVKVNETEVTQA